MTRFQDLPLEVLARIGLALPLHEDIHLFMLLREHNIVPRLQPLLDAWLMWDGEGHPSCREPVPRSGRPHFREKCLLQTREVGGERHPRTL